jgi:hypothetical protein
MWQVSFHPEFELEFAGLPQGAQDELLARLKLLATFGPSLGRPNVDTLTGSSFANMRVEVQAGWPVAFCVRIRS